MTVQRISSYYTHLQSLSNIKTARDAFTALQDKMVSGKEINKPKDDPIGIRQVLDLSTRIAKTEQYRKNINYTKGSLDIASETLNTVEDILMEIKDLAQTQGSAAVTSAERAASALTIEGYLEELVSLANTKYLGKFVFGGTNTLSGTAAQSKPFNITEDSQGYVTAVTPNPRGIDDLQQREVREGYYIASNIAGTAPFMPDGEGSASDIFQAVMDLRDHLLNNDTDSLNNDISNLEDSIDQVVQQDADIGVSLNRLDSIDSQHDVRSTTYKEMKSNIEDVDYADLMIKYNTADSVLQMTLQTAASLLQISLANYL